MTGVFLGSASSSTLAGHANAATDDRWDQVAGCESGENWAINTGNKFQDRLQFTPTTWRANGGAQYATEAQRATKEQQITVGAQVLAGQGRGAWPVCGGPLANAAPRQVPSDLPRPATVRPNNTDADSASPVGGATSEESAPDTPVPSDTVEAADVTVNPAAAPYVSADPPLQHQDPDVATEPREADVAPHPDISPASASLQDVESLPDADKVPADPPTEPTAQLVHASASNLAYDIAKEAAIVGLIDRYSGTPYIWGGDSPRGTDCSGLASWLANAATGRPIFGDRFDTSTEESALLARGFQYGTAPGALVIGWNDHHTAVTLADGTPAASGEGGGVRFGGGGAYQAQFNHHMYLPITPRPEDSQPAAPEGAGL